MTKILYVLLIVTIMLIALSILLLCLRKIKE